MAVKELEGPPNLLSLYPKAALSGLLPGGKGGDEALPESEYVRHRVTVDPAQLAAYNRVCGFRLGDELPATYPHVLAFGLQVSLMTERDFPFSLLGMVHVANRITQHRPVRTDEEFSLRVCTQNLRAHEKGTQFDVVSELIPSTADSPVWTDVSTYLRRGGGSGSGGQREQLAPPTPDAVWRISDDIGRRYADVSGDRNPIHLHSLSARLFGFPSAIAHGMWTKAYALASFEGRLPQAYTVDVRFKAPVLLPAKAGFTSWRQASGWAFELWDTRKPKPHLAGTIETG